MLAVGEVAGGAEDDDEARVGDPLEARADAERIGLGRAVAASRCATGALVAGAVALPVARRRRPSRVAAGAAARVAIARPSPLSAP